MQAFLHRVAEKVGDEHIEGLRNVVSVAYDMLHMHRNSAAAKCANMAAMENEAVKFETDADVSRDDPLGFIMRDMAQNEHLRESMRLATLIQTGMRNVHPGPSRGVKQAGLVVLVTAFMPAVLVEIGFGTNKLEAQYMTDTDRQRELASTLADAVVRYLEQYERKVGGGG
jgi:N-acetylmuramoyl-L-alanine amidase